MTQGSCNMTYSEIIYCICATCIFANIFMFLKRIIGTKLGHQHDHSTEMECWLTNPAGIYTMWCSQMVFHMGHIDPHLYAHQKSFLNGHAWPFFSRFMELLNFHDRLEAGLRDDDSYKEMWRNHIMAWNLLAWCNVPWSGLLFEMAQSISLMIMFG